MKKIIGAAFLVLVFALGWVVYADGKIDEAADTTADRDTSYAFGMVIGAELKQTGLIFNYNAFTQGLREILEDKDTGLTMDDAIMRVQIAFLGAISKRAEENKAKELEFLEENSKKLGMNITPSGLQYEVITEGTGQKPTADNIVRVNYEGTLIDGTVFDSTYNQEEPTEFPLYGIIPGWTEGIQLMNEGSIYRLYIPSKLAYGEQGAGSVIPPYATLIFNVELISILEEDPGEGDSDETSTE